MRFANVLAMLLLIPAVYARAIEEGYGLAASYPRDAGIENDPDVVFVENFEEAAINDMKARWEEVREDGQMLFTSDVPADSSGSQSLLMKLTGDQYADHLYRRVLPGYDELYMRYYVKFDPDCWDIHHFTWMGGHNPSTAWPWPRAGERPTGDERLSSGIETMGGAWRWDFYTYWMEMRTNPDTKYWGNDFVNDSNCSVQKGQWICVEQMLKMNNPTSGRSGEQAFWINGQLWREDGQVTSHLGEGFPKGGWVWDSWLPDPAGSPFEGYRWRTTTNLKINYIWPELYITTAPAGHESRVWFDDMVVAKSYIGPMFSPGDEDPPVVELAHAALSGKVQDNASCPVEVTIGGANIPVNVTGLSGSWSGGDLSLQSNPASIGISCQDASGNSVSLTVTVSH